MPTARFSKFGDRFALHTIKLAVLWSGVLQSFSAQTTQTACWGHKDSADPQNMFWSWNSQWSGKRWVKGKTFQEWILKLTSKRRKGSLDCSRVENLYSLQFRDFYLDQNTLALYPMRIWAWSIQLPNYTHLQRGTLNCFRCRWDNFLIAVLRRYQLGNAFYSPLSTMQWAESYHAGFRWKTILKHTWQRHANKATNAQLKVPALSQAEQLI